MRRSEKQVTQQYIAPHHARQITHSEAAYSPRPLSDRDALRFSMRPDRRAGKTELDQGPLKCIIGVELSWV